MTTYLVGVDGSEQALAALEWARAVATADESIVAVHGWDVPVVTGFEGAAAGVSTVDPLTIEQASKDFLSGVLAGKADARISPPSRPGPAGRALADLAGELGGDVTVVVGHGGSSKASLLLGSTAHTSSITSPARSWSCAASRGRRSGTPSSASTRATTTKSPTSGRSPR